MSTMTADRYHFLIRRVHSLMGLLPIGIFFVFHMFLNLSARSGAAVYDNVIGTMRELPGLIIVEVVVIFLPIAFHAIYGCWVVYGGQSNILRYVYVRNWFYLIQRISGIYVFAFVLIHVWMLRFGDVSFAAMQHILNNPLGFLFYAWGVVLAGFHFANGLWAFAITWGLTIGPHSQKVWAYVCGLLFLAIAVIGLLDLQAFLK